MLENLLQQRDISAALAGEKDRINKLRSLINAVYARRVLNWDYSAGMQPLPVFTPRYSLLLDRLRNELWLLETPARAKHRIQVKLYLRSQRAQ